MSLQHEIRLTARNTCNRIRPYAMTIAGGFWVASSLSLGFAHLLGGTKHESIGGWVILAGETTACVLGKKWRPAYNAAAFGFITGTLIQRGPEFISSLP